MTFKSAIDHWLAFFGLVFPVLMVVVALFLVAPLPPEEWLVVIVVVVVSLMLPVWLFLSTRYTVENDRLLVRSGPFRWRIALSEIHSVTPSRSLLSSPALSLNRLDIHYGNGRHLLVSPKDQTGFLTAIGQLDN